MIITVLLSFVFSFFIPEVNSKQVNIPLKIQLPVLMGGSVDFNQLWKGQTALAWVKDWWKGLMEFLSHNVKMRLMGIWTIIVGWGTLQAYVFPGAT